jgi:SAM-dependent methyltransferase
VLVVAVTEDYGLATITCNCESSMTRIAYSGHYDGSQGEDYYRWQSEIGHVGATRNRFKFEDYVSESDTVLDFGCGGGLLLAGLPVSCRLGVEVNPAARADALKNKVRVFKSLSDVDSLSVDVVISNHALEHTLRPFDELVEISRVLKRGGRFVLWLPLNDWRTDRKIASDTNHHLYAWTTLTLRNCLAEAGFDVEECRVVTSAWLPRLAPLERLLPRSVVKVMRYWTAVFLRRREIKAVACPTTDDAHVKAQSHEAI